MPEEMEVDGVVIRVRIVGENLQEVLQQITDVLRAAGRVGEEVQNGFRQGQASVRQMAVQIKAASTELDAISTSAAGIGKNSENIDRFAERVGVLTDQLEKQKAKVEDLKTSLDAMAAVYVTAAQSAGRSDDVDLSTAFPDQTATLRQAIAELEEYRRQITLAHREQEAFYRDSPSKSLIQEQAPAWQEQEKSLKKAQSGYDGVAGSIQDMSSTFGGVVDSMDDVTTVFTFMTDIMGAAEGSAGQMAMGIAGSVMLGINIISSLILSAAKEKEKARQVASEAAQAYSLVNEEMDTIERNIDVLKSQTATMEQVRTAKEALATTFPLMVAGFDEEGNAILKNLDILERELDVKREMIRLNKEIAAASAQTSADKYADKKKGIKSPEDIEIELRSQDGGGNGVGEELLKSEIARAEKRNNEINQELLVILDETRKNLLAKIEVMADEQGLDGIRVAQAMFPNLEILEEAMSQDDFNVDTFSQGLIDQYTAAFSSLDENVRKKLEDDDLPANIRAAVDEVMGKAIQDGNISGVQAATEELLKGGFTNLSTGVETFQQRMEEGTYGLNEAIAELLKDSLPGLGNELATLQQRISSGVASDGEIVRYGEALSKLQGISSKTGASFSILTKASQQSAGELRNAAIKAAASQKSYLDISRDVHSLHDGFHDLNGQLKDIGALKAAAAAINEGKGAKGYAVALAYVAEQFGVTEEEAAGMGDTLNNQVLSMENLALAQIQAGIQAAESNKMMIYYMQMAGAVTLDQAKNMVGALDSVILKYQELLNAEGTGLLPIEPGNIPKPSPKSGGGGGGGKSAVQKQTEQLENKKKLDDLTYAEELAWLERIRKKYTRNADERRQLDEQIYALKKQMAQAELDHLKAMDRLTLSEEISALENQLRLYRSGTSARTELEEKLYALKKERQQQDYDLMVHYSQLNLKQQEAYIKSQISQYKVGTQSRIDLEKQLYDLQKQMREENAQRIDNIADALTTALENRYEEQRKIEAKRLDDSIAAWQDWAKEQVDVIQQQIDAIDELTKEEDRAEEERKRRRKIAALEQQLQYEQDEYNRKKLQDEVAKARSELEEYLTRLAREDQKESLRKQMDAINEKASAEQEALEKQKEANDAYFDELTKAHKLQAEAQKLLMRSSQAELIDLIKAFAPEYNATGQTLGEQLVDGFASRVGDIESWFNAMNSKILSYQQQMAQVANQAADRFWSTRGGAPSSMSQADFSSPPEQNITINFNQPVQSPSETAQAIKRALEDIYRDY